MDSIISRFTYADFNSGANGNVELLDRVQYEPNFLEKEIKKLSMTVDIDCEIVINGHSTIKVKPALGFQLDKEDTVIKSLVVKTPNINVYAIVGY